MFSNSFFFLLVFILFFLFVIEKWRICASDQSKLLSFGFCAPRALRSFFFRFVGHQLGGAAGFPATSIYSLCAVPWI